jgi:hypothetical protein
LGGTRRIVVSSWKSTRNGNLMLPSSEVEVRFMAAAKAMTIVELSNTGIRAVWRRQRCAPRDQLTTAGQLSTVRLRTIEQHRETVGDETLATRRTAAVVALPGGPSLGAPWTPVVGPAERVVIDAMKSICCGTGYTRSY